MIVEEAERYPVDRDLVWMFADWRLTTDAQIASGFGNAMEAAMSGRVGNTVTVNGAISSGEQVHAGERIRLRLINGALARIMALRFEGHRPVIIAVDGQPCQPHQPPNGRLLLGPAMRIDIVLNLRGKPGHHYAVRDDLYENLAYTVTHLNYSANAALRTARDDNDVPLPGNPLPEPDLQGAEPHQIVLQGGMMGGGMMHGMGGKGNSINSPLLSFEVTQSGYGMYVKYLMAGFLVVFAVSMLIQFVSYLLFNISELTGASDDAQKPSYRQLIASGKAG